MSEIKLFVSCHKACALPKHELLVPMQVGAALTDERFPGFIQDDTGENISALNRSYCELTAQYWAWKNCAADYLGFFHYRRFLYPDTAEIRPYRVEKAADEGDKIAVDIFRDAAYSLAACAEAGYNKYGLDKNTPYTFSGGVILHDIKREKPLMLPYITEYLSERGITNRVMPKTTPLLAAAEWIRRNVIK